VRELPEYPKPMPGDTAEAELLKIVEIASRPVDSVCLAEANIWDIGHRAILCLKMLRGET